MKPKLTSRVIVNSAKINLNRYWHKFEQLIADTKIVKKNKKKLRKLKSVNQQLLNNRIFPMIQQEVPLLDEVTSGNDEIYGFTTAKFPHQQQQNTTATLLSTQSDKKSAYKPFIDDSLYQGVNLNANIPTLMTTSSKLPSHAPYMIDKTSINYNYYLSEQRQKASHNFNDNTIYLQQLNESLRRKGWKFTLAEIKRTIQNEEEMYYNGQYLEDEGYLV
jgi:carboxylesterase type B